MSSNKLSSKTIWKLVRLDFKRNPVHFGETGIGLEHTTERIHSDTLFSALAIAYLRIFGVKPLEALLAQFTQQSSPPFQLSSTFIYQQLEGKTVDYLPIPVVRPPNYPEQNDRPFAKAFKKLTHLPLPVWHRWYQQGGFGKQDIKELTAYAQSPEKVNRANSQLKSAGTFDYGNAYAECDLPKVSIDRTTRATNFYHTRFIHYEQGAGLYFLVALPQENGELLQRLQAALMFLGEEGVGGERSSGSGRFEASWHDLSAEWKQALTCDNKTHHSLLSLFWTSPNSEQFCQLLSDGNNDVVPDAYYGLKPRGGWIDSPTGNQRRRKVVNMFTEGSVLPKTAFPEAPIGELADVTPHDFFTNDGLLRSNRHRIYRSGVSLSLPVALEV